MKLKNMKTFEEKTSELNISDVISRLSKLDRYNIISFVDDGWYGRKNSGNVIDSVDSNGIYVRWEDIQKIINDYNGLYKISCVFDARLFANHDS